MHTRHGGMGLYNEDQRIRHLNGSCLDTSQAESERALVQHVTGPKIAIAETRATLSAYEERIGKLSFHSYYHIMTHMIVMFIS